MLAAFCLDLCIGDPRWLPHPVRGMGRAIGKLEGLLRRLAEEAPAPDGAGNPAFDESRFAALREE